MGQRVNSHLVLKILSDRKSQGHTKSLLEMLFSARFTRRKLSWTFQDNENCVLTVKSSADKLL